MTESERSGDRVKGSEFENKIRGARNFIINFKMLVGLLIAFLANCCLS